MWSPGLLVCYSFLVSLCWAKPLDEHENASGSHGHADDDNEKGYYLTQGDILMPKKKYGYPGARPWTNGVVPYTFNSNVGSRGRSVLRQAMDFYERNTCIRFKERTTEGNYIIFKSPSDGCNSWVGMQGGSQVLNMAPYCFDHIGTALHEMMHALGFTHEQSREDRDSFINIHWDNIEEDFKKEFRIVKGGNTYGARYDMSSVMHYDAWTFSRNGKYTLTPKNGADPKVLGNWNTLTAGDLYKVNTLYNCNHACRDKHTMCGEWAMKWNPSECEVNPSYMLYSCERSCNVCGARQGCYDQSSVAGVWRTTDLMSPQYCKRYCGQRGYTYASLKNHNKCYCSNVLPNGAKLSDFRCNLKCVGASHMTCGGQDILEVYRV